MNLKGHQFFFTHPVYQQMVTKANRDYSLFTAFNETRLDSGVNDSLLRINDYDIVWDQEMRLEFVYTCVAP